MIYEKIELEEKESVLKLARQHWFIIVAQLFGTLIMLLAPFFILFVVMLMPEQLLPFNLNLEAYMPIIIFGITFWSLIAVMAGFAIWTHYYLDLWVITDRRIIVIEQIGFFNRKVSSFRLERLQDIKFSVSGIIPTFLNFGTVRAQTAGELENNFESASLPNPQEIQSVIQKATDIRLRYLGSLHTMIE